MISTLREVPGEAEIASHKLMLRTGMIQKVSSGLYTFLPLGLRVLKKVCQIIREELYRRNCQEILMPILQPKEIWEKSGRYEAMGPLMMRLKNREGKEFVLGPTHEEIVVDTVLRRVNSYRQLPINLYQIQTKFRDEIRPRFGVMRSKEFIMKDGYSFDMDQDGLDRSYQEMYQAYEVIFKRCGLKAVPVRADTGVMGGNESHEFMVLAESGEDALVVCERCHYAANVEMAERLPLRRNGTESVSLKKIEKVDTPNLRTVEELASFFKTDSSVFIKTLIYLADEEALAVLTRGDISINEGKLARALKAKKIALADAKVIEKVTHAPVGFAGPVGLSGVRVYADLSVQGMVNAIAGANKKDQHLVNVNMGRDFIVSEFLDIGSAKAGDLCPKCNEEYKLFRGVEVGQVFKLGTKYSEALGASFLDKGGQSKPMVMGCYGIGVSRTVAAIVEQHHDENGIIWPVSVAPFQAVVLILNSRDAASVALGEEAYKRLQDAGVEVLLDDREERAGVKFKAADLIGFPLKVIVGERNAAVWNIEIKKRSEINSQVLPEGELVNVVKRILEEEGLYT